MLSSIPGFVPNNTLRCDGLRALVDVISPHWTLNVATTVIEGKDLIELQPKHRCAANKRLWVKYLWTRLIRAVIRECKRQRNRRTMLQTLRTSDRLPFIIRLLATQYADLLTDQMLRRLWFAYRLPHDDLVPPTNFWRHAFSFAKEEDVQPIVVDNQGHNLNIFIANDGQQWECKGTLFMSF